MQVKKNCSLCESKKLKNVLSLGNSPVANTFYKKKNKLSKLYPLKVDFCEKCLNIQLRHCLNSKDLYSNYSYTTPSSASLSNHYKKLINFLKKIKAIKSTFIVLEIGSNNGFFLKHLSVFAKKTIGVDPAKNIIKKNLKKKIKIYNNFFTLNLAEKLKRLGNKCNLIVARHVLAHNENPRKIIEGVPILLQPKGKFVVENAYSLTTIKNNQFDQVYHEHMFYFSVNSFNQILKSINFEVIDFEHSSIHGGSIVMICAKKGDYRIKKKVIDLISYEKKYLSNILNFKNFIKRINIIKKKLTLFLKANKNKVIGSYGAPAKAFTSFVFFNLTNKIIKFCCDNSENKKRKYFAHFDIPIYEENYLKNIDYDIIIVNSWNYKDEIIKKSSKIFKKGTILVFLIPRFYLYKVK